MATQVKKELVAELVEKIKKAQSVVFVDYQGIKVNEETSLRKQMRENGAEYLVAKNRLFKIALKESGVEDDGCARRQGQPADFSERVLCGSLVAVEGEAAEQRAFASDYVFAVPLRQVGFFVHLDATVGRFGLFCGVNADGHAEQKGDGQCGK